MSDKTVSVVSKNDCTACMACFNACPVDAISMNENEEGFVFPVIDEAKCINCGKCAKSCLVLNPPARDFKEEPECYAMQGNDEIRFKSSSGGMFTYIAEYVLSKGGSVCGSAWTEDWMAEHIVTNRIEDLQRIRGAKYFQSDMGKCMREVKKLLNKGEYVFFTGTGCQVEALYAFLGKDYEKLITMDILCHGTPSAAMLKKYLEDVSEGREIESLSFRDKKPLGWETTSLIKFKDGTEYFNTADKDPWYRAFLLGLMSRPSCYHCKHPNTQMKRVSDITVGDFWGVGQLYKKELYSKLGVSLVILNSPKGKAIYKELEPQFKVSEKISNKKVIDIGVLRNIQLVFPSVRHKYSKLFLETVWNRNFKETVERSLAGKFDIGVVGWWYNENYGGVLTYYALHQVLKSMGLSVLMIDKPSADPKYKPSESTVSRRFALKHYNISDIYEPKQMSVLNKKCDNFISGSDQLFASWAWPYGEASNYLDFAETSKNKIGYASSFGNTYNASPEFIMRSSYLLHRFNSLSVREDYAVDVVKENFGLDAVQVLDPVFVCDPQEYDKLIEQSSAEKESNYVLSFFLDPDSQKREALLALSERMGEKYVNLIHATDFKSNIQKLDLDNIIANADVEDWLAYYKNADFVITDSFHGTCFAIIFKKPFVSIANKQRGDRRFVSMLKTFGLLDRLVDNPDEISNNEKLFEPIDYDKVYQILEEKRAFSYAWLYNAIFNPPQKSAGTFGALEYGLYDKLYAIISQQQKEISALKKRLGVVLVNKSEISATTITRGEEINFIGKAENGVAPYRYQFVVKNKVDSKWMILQDYDLPSVKSWTPERVGTYTAAIKVKDAADVTVVKEFTFTVKLPE